MSEPAWKAELSRALVLYGFLAETDEERMAVVMPHIEAAFKRGHEAGRSQAGYRLVEENERLRRELELAHQSKRREGICPSCLSILPGGAASAPAAGGTTPASAGEP